MALYYSVRRELEVSRCSMQNPQLGDFGCDTLSL